MSLDLANQNTAAGVASCQQKGYAVAVTVVDRASSVKAVQRADNAGPHTLEAGWAKTYTSASAKNATLAMMENARKNPPAASLIDIPVFCCLAAACRSKLEKL